LLIPPRAGLRVGRRTFELLCRLNPELRLERSARGDLDVMPPAGAGTGHTNARLTTQLCVWADHDGTGLAFDSSAGFTLPNGAVRAPDASWVLKARWEALTAEQRKTFAPLCPDFVAELASPSDDLGKLRAKMREYIDQGARLGWLLNPDTVEVEVYRPGQPVETLKKPETLPGGDVLPGFVLRLPGILFD
jgi:Uma2 family endonuclease